MSSFILDNGISLPFLFSSQSRAEKIIGSCSLASGTSGRIYHFTLCSKLYIRSVVTTITGRPSREHFLPSYIST